MSTQFVLVSSPTTIFYKTGFGDPLGRERDAWMLLCGDNTYFFTDGRFENKALVKELAHKNVEFKLLSAEKRLAQHLKEIAGESEIAFEKNDLTVAELELFREKGVKLEGEYESDSLRVVKSDEEILHIKKACELVDSLLGSVIPQIKVGMSEKEILRLLYSQLSPSDEEMIEHAFTPIVAIDENSAVAHYDTKAHGDKRLKQGSLILIDCGIRYKNYCSDITRMISVGEPIAEVKGAYTALFTAQQQAITALSTLSTYKEVDELCRTSLQKAGFPVYSHATGHGIGIQVHENPRFSPISTDTIKPGHVITVEPGIYMPEKWGMRLEDTVLINADRSVTSLTATNRELIII